MYILITDARDERGGLSGLHYEDKYKSIVNAPIIFLYHLSLSVTSSLLVVLLINCPLDTENTSFPKLHTHKSLVFQLSSADRTRKLLLPVNNARINTISDFFQTPSISMLWAVLSYSKSTTTSTNV